MRDIKFRAKVKGDAGIWNVTAIDWLNKRVMLDGARANWHPIEKIQDLMQFTSLHDKNGVEIFEGDLLRFFDPRTESWKSPIDWVGEVVFKQGAFQISQKREGQRNLFWQLQSPEFIEVTVIGNIYLNPELLK